MIMSSNPRNNDRTLSTNLTLAPIYLRPSIKEVLHFKEHYLRNGALSCLIPEQVATRATHRQERQTTYKNKRTVETSLLLSELCYLGTSATPGKFKYCFPSLSMVYYKERMHFS